MGPDSAAAVARSDGGDDVQSLDLLASETARRGAENGTSSADEGDQRGEKQKRQDRWAYHIGPAALQPVAGVFRDFSGVGSVTAATAIPAADDRASSDVQEQNGGTADGSGGGIRAQAFAREALFRRAAGPQRMDRKPDAAIVGVQPGADREFTRHGPAAATDARGPSAAAGADRSFTGDRRGGAGDGADLGAGGGDAGTF